MKKLIFGAACALLVLTIGGSAETLDVTNSYNFPLSGGGGGAAATLNGVSVEIFCDDFDNNISLGTDYSANVTTLGTSASLSDTRFGGVSGLGWTQFATLGSQDDAFFNAGGAGSTALARYAMVAYLVSLYNQTPADYPVDNQIQDAIWSIMDPAGETVSDPGVNGTSFVEQAANWYMGMDNSANLTALNNFLSHYQVVSPASMDCANRLANCGFQEQIVDANPIPAPTPTPEPRGVALMLLGVFAIGMFGFGRARAAGSGVHLAS
ncbi:MAG: hypothetical protein ACLPWF_31900 [Bryobacteraceae bacterium]